MHKRNSTQNIQGLRFYLRKIQETDQIIKNEDPEFTRIKSISK